MSEWIKKEKDGIGGLNKCPHCSKVFVFSDKSEKNYRFCPYCGSAMEDGIVMYAVVRTHNFDGEQTINAFGSYEAAGKYLVAEYHGYLEEEMRENPGAVDYNNTGCAYDMESARVSWVDGDRTEFTVSPVFFGACENHGEELDEHFLYEIYKRLWCQDRKWEYRDVRACDLNDEEYNGQMYVCFEEFCSTELEAGAAGWLINEIEIVEELDELLNRGEENIGWYCAATCDKGAKWCYAVREDLTLKEATEYADKLLEDSEENIGGVVIFDRDGNEVARKFKTETSTTKFMLNKSSLYMKCRSGRAHNQKSGKEGNPFEFHLDDDDEWPLPF